MSLSCSNVAAIALSPAGQQRITLTRYQKAAIAQEKKANRKRRERRILDDLKSQADEEIIMIMSQPEGHWFYGVTHDYLDYSLTQARKLYPERTLYVYRTDDVLIELRHSVTEETFPPLDLTVKINDEARRAYMRMGKDLNGQIDDQMRLIKDGYDGCAATYFATRFTACYCLNKYGNHGSPDQMIVRPILEIYTPDSYERQCVDTADYGQGTGINKITNPINPPNEYEEWLFSQIISAKEWTDDD